MHPSIRLYLLDQSGHLRNRHNKLKFCTWLTLYAIGSLLLLEFGSVRAVVITFTLTAYVATVAALALIFKPFKP